MPSFENQVYPSDPAQMAAMQQPGPAGPIYMVNLLRFKERAEYPDGRESELTGREAYQLYGQAVSQILGAYGGAVVFAGDVTHLSLGRVDELWDEIAIVSYPSRGDLLAMSTSKEWREAAIHREAGLAGQLNIETTAIPGIGKPAS